MISTKTRWLNSNWTILNFLLHIENNKMGVENQLKINWCYTFKQDGVENLEIVVARCYWPLQKL